MVGVGLLAKDKTYASQSSGVTELLEKRRGRACFFARSWKQPRCWYAPGKEGFVRPPDGRMAALVVLERMGALVGRWLPEVVVARLVDGPVVGGFEEADGRMAMVERVVGIDVDDAAAEENAAMPKPTDEVGSVPEIEANAGLN